MLKPITIEEFEKFSKYYLKLNIKAVTKFKRTANELHVEDVRKKWILKKLTKKYVILSKLAAWPK